MVTYNLKGDLGGKERALKETRKLGPAISFDGGEKWQFGPDIYANLDVDRMRYSHVVKYGTTLEYRFNGPNFHKRTISAEWFDGDKAIKGPETVYLSIPFGYRDEFRIMDNGVVLSNGSWMFTATTKNKSTKQWEVFSLISDDQGESFSYGSTILDYDKCTEILGHHVIGPSESAIIKKKNGELLCIIRSGQTTFWGFNPLKHMGNMLIAKSKDDGNTWDVRDFGRPGVNPVLLRMSNGVLCLAYGRPGNNLLFSCDDGETWGNEVALTAADIKTSGYVGITEVEPGRLLAVYDVHDTDTSGIWLWEPEEVNGVFGVFVDVKKRW
jgi:hypothetical protein